MRPMKAHYLNVIATKSTLEEDNFEGASEYEMMLMLLSRHRKTLKTIQSAEFKSDYKAKILPEFLPWIEGVIYSDVRRQDDMVMRWAIWSIDANAFELAIDIADYAIFHDLVLPAKDFSRSTATAITEEFVDKAKIYREKQNPIDIALLTRLEKVTHYSDMIDEVRAKLHREIGMLLMESEPENALTHFRRALELDNRVGVKQLADKLEKQLTKNTTPTE